MSRILYPIVFSICTLILSLAQGSAQSPAQAQARQSSTIKPVEKPFTIPKTPIADLKSDRLLDYEPLQDLLKLGKWQEAAAITSTLMLKAGSQLEQGYLVEANIRYFPCNDLLTVDKLWRYYSGDRFGLSTQSHIWVTIGGKDEKDVPRFEKRLGWGRAIADVSRREQFPVGYFPLRPASGGGVTEAWGGHWIAEMPKRLVICQAPPKNDRPSPKKTHSTAQPHSTSPKKKA